VQVVPDAPLMLPIHQRAPLSLFQPSSTMLPTLQPPRTGPSPNMGECTALHAAPLQKTCTCWMLWQVDACIAATAFAG
jgi:hypothetical protein